jgi:hypothetical protein
MDHFLVFHHDVLCYLELEHPKLNSWIRPWLEPVLVRANVNGATYDGVGVVSIISYSHLYLYHQYKKGERGADPTNLNHQISI